MKKMWASLSTVGRWVLVFLVILIIGWAAYTLKLNVGGLIAGILGRNKKRVTPVVDDEGKQIGVRLPIKIDNSPLRDKTAVMLESGTEIKLPKGIKDKDVVSITKVLTDYHVEIKHRRYTDVFS